MSTNEVPHRFPHSFSDSLSFPNFNLVLCLLDIVQNYFGCFFCLPIVISSMRWGISAGRKTMVCSFPGLKYSTTSFVFSCYLYILSLSYCKYVSCCIWSSIKTGGDVFAAAGFVWSSESFNISGEHIYIFLKETSFFVNIQLKYKRIIQ